MAKDEMEGAEPKALAVRGAGGSPVFKYLGVAGAVAVVASLFLPWFSYPELDVTMSFVGPDLAQWGDAPFIMIACVFVAVAQLLNKPLVSLVGCAFLVFEFVMILTVAPESPVAMELGVGFWLFACATTLCVAMAFLAQRSLRA